MKNEKQDQKKNVGRVRQRRQALAVVIILAVSIGVSVWFMNHRPKAQRRQPASITPIVEVSPLAATNIRTRIEAMGTVEPSDEVTLQAEVSGRIVRVNPALEEGRFVTNGTVLLEIDPRDYRLTLAQREAMLDTARSDMRLEEGQQDIARIEWKMINNSGEASDLDRELALRQPHLTAAKASVKLAEAVRDQAVVNLERTRVRAPFDAIVAEADADVGDQAAQGAVLARLTGTKNCRIVASIHRNDLRWLRFANGNDKNGSDVIVYLQGEKTRQGRLETLLPELELQGRMARVMVNVSDPFARDPSNTKLSKVLLGSFVRIELLGQIVKNVVCIPRTAVRDGNTIWLIDGNHQLKIVTPSILWETDEAIYVTYKFQADMQLITSDIATPVEGMPLSIIGEEEQPVSVPNQTHRKDRST